MDIRQEYFSQHECTCCVLLYWVLPAQVCVYVHVHTYNSFHMYVFKCIYVRHICMCPAHNCMCVLCIYVCAACCAGANLLGPTCPGICVLTYLSVHVYISYMYVCVCCVLLRSYLIGPFLPRYMYVYTYTCTFVHAYIH